MLLFRSFLCWLAILVLAFANGMLREEFLIPTLGHRNGLLLSGAFLSALIALVAYFFVRARPGMTAAHGLQVGAFWFCMTLVFEFGFGRFVQHKTWTALLDAYTFSGGNIWPIVLVVTLFAPVAATWLCGRQNS